MSAALIFFGCVRMNSLFDIAPPVPRRADGRVAVARRLVGFGADFARAVRLCALPVRCAERMFETYFALIAMPAFAARATTSAIERSLGRAKTKSVFVGPRSERFAASVVIALHECTNFVRFARTVRMDSVVDAR